jgi:hypothetical protein
VLSITGFQPGANTGFGNGGITAIKNVGPGGVGSDVAANQFVLTYQSAAEGFLPATQVDPNLNVTHQLTFTVQAREFVTSVSADGKTFQFAVSANQTGMAGLQMWANNAVTFDASGLNGTTYKPAGATLILTAAATSSLNNSFTNSPGTGLLNQSPGATGWGNQQTVNGTGGSVVNFTTSFVNTSYFPGGIPPVIQATFTGSQNLPFRTINPAQTMWDGTATQPLIGTTNGDPTGTGTSTLFEVTGTLAAVPEPSSVFLTAVGLGGVVMLFRRKKERTA